MLSKILALGMASLVGVALATATPQEPPDDPPPPHKDKKDKKEKDAPKPGGDLRKSYDLLRRLRADGRAAGRPEERLRDWTERATKLYREAVQASERGDERRSRELGTAAHDLARAVDHARNAAISALDDELPPPPDPGGPGGEGERALRDLRRARDRIVALADGDEPDAKFFHDASKDLYNAARRDAEAGRMERAGELARAAEALTHVPEHLARAGDGRPEPKENRTKPAPKERPEPKEEGDRPGPPKAKRDRPEPKGKPAPPDEKRDRPRPGGDIPPPID